MNTKELVEKAVAEICCFAPELDSVKVTEIIQMDVVEPMQKCLDDLTNASLDVVIESLKAVARRRS